MSTSVRRRLGIGSTALFGAAAAGAAAVSMTGAFAEADPAADTRRAPAVSETAASVPPTAGVPTPVELPAEPRTETPLAADGSQRPGSPVAFLPVTHAEMVRRFDGAKGFGHERVIRLDYDLTYPLPTPDLATGETPAVGPAGPADAAELTTFHALSVGDFTGPAPAHLTRPKEAAHAFGNPLGGIAASPAPADGPATRAWAIDADTADWKLVRLELVSLLEHDEPAVYVSKHYPRIDEAAQAPTRPLDGFEADALAKLLGGEDLIAARGADRIVMLGALRASQACYECHAVGERTLLGAFSYEFQRPSPQDRRVGFDDRDVPLAAK